MTGFRCECGAAVDCTYPKCKGGLEMTTDITERLQDYARDYTTTTYHDALICEAATEITQLRQQLAEAQVFESLWTGACEVAKNDPVQAIYRVRDQVKGLEHERNNLLETVTKQDAEIAALTVMAEDAERYRWLMKDDGHNALMSVLASLCASDDPIKPQMDDAIDRAIAATEH